MMPESLSTFFGLEFHSGELNICLEYNKVECKRLAWFGDVLLSTILAKSWEEKAYSIGEMTQRKAHYASNNTMKLFLIGGTDAEDRIEAPPTNDILSDHTYGTIFEALLMTCANIGGMEKAKQSVVQYCAWVDKNVPRASSTVLCEITVYNDILGEEVKCVKQVTEKLNTPSLCAIGSEMLEKMSESITITKIAKEVAIIQANDRYETISMCVQINGPKNSKFQNPASSEHYHDTIVGVEWRSRTRNQYSDRYHTCCGVRGGVNKCFRKLWIDTSAKHPGELYIVATSGRRGGGRPQEFNHVPRGSIPKWSCCFKTALSPGCVSLDPQYAMPPGSIEMCTDEYKEKVDAWLEQDYVTEQQDLTVEYGGMYKINRMNSEVWKNHAESEEYDDFMCF